MSTQDSICADLAALVVGSQLQHPLCDGRGILLLSQGATITEDVKRILADRGIEKVQIHQDDVASVVSAPARTEDTPQAIKAGATDYLLKPFDPSALREKVRKYCHQNNSFE